MRVTEDRIGDAFQIKTAYQRGRLPSRKLVLSDRPSTHKTYPETVRFSLPPPETAGGKGLWEALRQRRSERRYSDKPLSQQDLSQLLWATQGVTAQHRSLALRTAPSAGALYPIETYAVVHSVEDLPAGVYHYHIVSHALEQIEVGNFRTAAAAAALDQSFAGSSALLLIWTAVFDRSKWKYGQRAYRYIYLDAGHIAQNTALAAVALGLGSCQIAALYDDEANRLLHVDGEGESTVYMTAVGHTG